MFIQTQDTPNPATLKFIPGVPVMAQGTADFADSDSANKSPLARRLFQVDGVTAVFLGADFVAVTKAEGLDWFALKPGILAGIMEHYASGMPVIEKDAELADPHAEDGDSDTVQQITARNALHAGHACIDSWLFVPVSQHLCQHCRLPA